MTADLPRLVASLLSAAAAGCATQPGGVAVAPRIVAGETPIEIRSSAGKPSQRPAEAAVPMLAACGIYLPFCPIVVLGAGVTAGWIRPAVLPAADSAGLAATFRQHATGVSLQERMLRLAEAAGIRAGAPESPRLVVRMDAAFLSYDGRSLSLSLRAQAQLLAPDSAESPPTYFRYHFPARPLADWTAHDDRLVRQAIDEALEAFARSIWATYMQRPLSRPSSSRPRR
jgi:hypothetical protein